jgi:hypothetical protein
VLRQRCRERLRSLQRWLRQWPATRLEAQQPEPRAVIQGPVLERPVARYLDNVHVDLPTVPQFRALKVLQLTGPRLG